MAGLTARPVGGWRAQGCSCAEPQGLTLLCSSLGCPWQALQVCPPPPPRGPRGWWCHDTAHNGGLRGELRGSAHSLGRPRGLTATTLAPSGGKTPLGGTRGERGGFMHPAQVACHQLRPCVGEGGARTRGRGSERVQGDAPAPVRAACRKEVLGGAAQDPRAEAELTHASRHGN